MAELAAAGAEVVFGYTRGADESAELAEETGARAVQADVSSAEEAARLVEEAGDVDILVNNAGLTRDGLLARMSDEDWRTVIDTNLSSVFYTCRAVTRPMMKKRAGAIVNISSIVGVHGNWGQTNYGASKAGIIGFTKSLARELGSRGVRANVVAPGYVKSRLTDVLPEEATAGDAHEHAARPARRAGGRGARGTVPLLRRGLVHHGRGAARRRRTGDVGEREHERQTGGGGSSSPGSGWSARSATTSSRSWRALVAGESGAGPITLFDDSDYPVHFACELKDFDPTDVDRPQGGAAHGSLRAARARGGAAGRAGLGRRRRARTPSRSARRSRPASAASTRSRTATTRCATAARIA